jgi:S1-C subfamily serine protease
VPHEADAKWLLRPLQVAGITESSPIDATGLTLGRADTNEVVIGETEFPYVSHHHARVRLDDGVPWIEDLGSKNGTLVNGKRRDRALLHNGDIVQLGHAGPRFAVVHVDGDPRDQPTQPVPVMPAPAHDLSQTTLVRLERALGIPPGSNLRDVLRRGTVRATWLSWLVLALIGAGLGSGVWAVSRRGASATEQLRAQLQQAEEELALQQSAWRSEKARLEDERAALLERLQKLEQDAGTSAGELARLRAALESTHQQLELFNPVNTELHRLEGVRRVMRAVVFIEAKTYFRHKESGRLLYARPGEDDALELNLDDAGDPYAFETSGSGFCVGTDGYILTNAHVVEPEDRDGPVSRSSSMFAPEVKLAVVFSGTSERRPARMVKAVYRDGIDVALVKIEPFPGMPHIDKIDLDRPVPEPATEVYLSGFPLGRMAIQQGEVLIASTFRGILSRVVPPYLQVDAAVHPGNSGGPVMDRDGNIVGVVTRVQRIPDGPYTPEIGYITPVHALADVWPPDEARER